MTEEEKNLSIEIDKYLDKYPMAYSCFGWLKTQCPKCKIYNWVSNYDDLCDTDCSKLDTPMSGCRCYSCDNVFWIDSMEPERIRLNLFINNIIHLKNLEDEDEIIIVDGKQEPDLE